MSKERNLKTSRLGSRVQKALENGDVALEEAIAEWGDEAFKETPG